MRYLLIIIGFSWLALAGCATNRSAPEPLSVSLAGVEMLEFGLFEQKLGFTLRVQNPNNTAIPLEGVSYGLEVNGKPFAKGTGPAQAEVPAFGTVEIQTEALSSLGGFLQQLGQIKSERGLQYRLVGKLHGSGTFSSQAFDSTGEISLPNLGDWQQRLQPQ